MADWNIAERHRETVGREPRIAPVALDVLTDDDLALIDELRILAGAEPASQEPEYMRTMIRHRRLFRCQMETSTALYEGALPPLERELAILRVAWLCGAPYEWAQHVMIAGLLGMRGDTIERAREGSLAGGWSAHEQAILTGVEELLADKVLSDETWDALARSWDTEQLIEFPMMVGTYVANAYLQNSLRVRLEGCEEGLARR